MFHPALTIGMRFSDEESEKHKEKVFAEEKDTETTWR